MTSLELPIALAGDWDHALFLTYGADLPFFENALWSPLRQCRNRIILADARQYLEASQSYAEHEILRHVNHRYLVEGIVAEHAVHAKAILLVNAEAGRLWVGSGNLGWQGYASGGELFTEYWYGPDQTKHLAAFLAVWELVSELQTRKRLSPSAHRHLALLAEETPWLTLQRAPTTAPVRHNLNTSFFKQLQTVLGTEPVQELWMLAPFLDKEAQALEMFLTTFKPRQATLLVQPAACSVEPSALERIMRAHPEMGLRAFEAPYNNTYIHAKVYLFKTADHAICFHGSPNLSLAALHFTDPRGNIELANLQIGPRDAFDSVFSPLTIASPVERASDLHLKYISKPSHSLEVEPIWQLIWGEWVAPRLMLGFRGSLPILDEVWVVVAETEFRPRRLQRHETHIEFDLPDEAALALQTPVTVKVRWGHAVHEVTNPIFVCHRATLDNTVQIRGDTGTLSGLSHLELEDNELEQLLGELDAVMLVDNRSIWRLVNKTHPTSSEADDDANVNFDYADIDYEKLRHHPKVLQYTRQLGGQVGASPTRLQLILNAITNHFNALLSPTSAATPISILTSSNPSPDSSTKADDESEENVDRESTHSVSWENRVNRLFQNFIRRYFRGFQQREFRQMVGYEVVIRNYVIFDHLLGRLFDKDWADGDFLFESRLSLWQDFWGSPTQPGYLAQLPPEETTVTHTLLSEYHSHAELLAGVCTLSQWLWTSEQHFRDNDWDTNELTQQRLRLREFWRQCLKHPFLAPTPTLMEAVWRIAGRAQSFVFFTPRQIVEHLTKLANWETRDTFVHSLSQQYGMRPSQFEFMTVRVKRPSGMTEGNVLCLVVAEARLLEDFETALALLTQWIRAETRDYYRIAWPDANQSTRLLFYDVQAREGTFFRKDNQELRDFRYLTEELKDWDAGLEAWDKVAADLGATLSLQAPSSTHVVPSSGSSDTLSPTVVSNEA